MIFPIIVIILSLLLGIGYFIYKKRNEYVEITEDEYKKQVAQDFINVKAIEDKILYTEDNKVIMYIKVTPVSIELFSENEKKGICDTLTAELSNLKKPFKFIAVSRPVDISPLINEYSELLEMSMNYKQKELLRKEMLVMSDFVMSREVVERQFYFIIWNKYYEGIENEMMKECIEFKRKFESGNVVCDILNSKEIIKLCNLINNPSYVHLEDSEYKRNMAVINGE